MRLRAEADRRAERLARQHVRAVELARDHAVEQHLPVRLRLERDVQAFVLEVAELVRDRERRHVGELDEAELELVLLERERLGRALGEPRSMRALRNACAQHRERRFPCNRRLP